METAPIVIGALSLILMVVGWVLHRTWARLDVAEALLRNKEETITELRRQNDRLMITAELTDRLLTAAQPKGTGS